MLEGPTAALSDIKNAAFKLDHETDWARVEMLVSHYAALLLGKEGYDTSNLS